MSSFSKRVGWEDITIVKQDDGPIPIVQIAYTTDFTNLMDLFRGVLAVGEYSERVLDLTKEILCNHNAGNYTVWQYRRECLRSMGNDLNDELTFMDSFAQSNPKNYQIWYHRRAIVEIIGSGDRELNFCNHVLEVDSKNYHAWCHRQWVIKTFNLWDDEILFLEGLIDDDVRNNSAWNQRWFIVHNSNETITREILEREINYTFDKINLIKSNESSWNYLRGLVKYHIELIPIIKQRCFEMVKTKEYNDNIFLLALLCDILEQEGNKTSIDEMIIYLNKLSEIDNIRTKYWNNRKLKHELNSNTNHCNEHMD